MLRTRLAQGVDIKYFAYIEKQTFQAQLSGFEQVAQQRVVPVAGLECDYGQRQTPVVGQKQGIGGVPSFALLIADGRSAVLGQRMAAVGLDAGQVQDAPVQAQADEPVIFSGPCLPQALK